MWHKWLNNHWMQSWTNSNWFKAGSVPATVCVDHRPPLTTARVQRAQHTDRHGPTFTETFRRDTSLRGDITLHTDRQTDRQGVSDICLWCQPLCRCLLDVFLFSPLQNSLNDVVNFLLFVCEARMRLTLQLSKSFFSREVFFHSLVEDWQRLQIIVWFFAAFNQKMPTTPVGRCRQECNVAFDH